MVSVFNITSNYLEYWTVDIYILHSKIDTRVYLHKGRASLTHSYVFAGYHITYIDNFPAIVVAWTRVVDAFIRNSLTVKDSWCWQNFLIQFQFLWKSLMLIFICFKWLCFLKQKREVYVRRAVFVMFDRANFWNDDLI